MSQPIRGQGGLFCFPSDPKYTHLVEDAEYLVYVKFRQIPFSGFRGEIKNVSANQRSERTVLFCDWPENTNLVERVEYNVLAFCKVHSNFVLWLQRKGRKSEARAAIFVFRLTRNTNLVERVEYLKSVKFRPISFGGCRGKGENTSANQRPGWSSLFSDLPEKHKLGRGSRALKALPNVIKSSLATILSKSHYFWVYQILTFCHRTDMYTVTILANSFIILKPKTPK